MLLPKVTFTLYRRYPWEVGLGCKGRCDCKEGRSTLVQPDELDTRDPFNGRERHGCKRVLNPVIIILGRGSRTGLSVPAWTTLVTDRVCPMHYVQSPMHYVQSPIRKHRQRELSWVRILVTPPPRVEGHLCIRIVHDAHL